MHFVETTEIGVYEYYQWGCSIKSIWGKYQNHNLVVIAQNA
jgi:hypothetical protein